MSRIPGLLRRLVPPVLLLLVLLTSSLPLRGALADENSQLEDRKLAADVSDESDFRQVPAKADPLPPLGPVFAQSGPNGGVGSRRDPTPTAAAGRWETYTSSALGIAVRHPASWHVYTDTMHGRYNGLNPILLTSFEVHFEAIGHGLGIPAGEAAVLVGFEGSDRSPDQSLADYALQHLSSPFYQPTGRELLLGKHSAVEMAGETGRMYVIGRGPNVYSAFTYAGNESSLSTVVDRVLSSLSPLRDGPIPVPEGTKALRGLEGQFIPLSQGLPRPSSAWGGPSLKMPWDRSAGYSLTGGPHTYSWPCV